MASSKSRTPSTPLMFGRCCGVLGLLSDSERHPTSAADKALTDEDRFGIRTAGEIEAPDVVSRRTASTVSPCSVAHLELVRATRVASSRYGPDDVVHADAADGPIAIGLEFRCMVAREEPTLPDEVFVSAEGQGPMPKSGHRPQRRSRISSATHGCDGFRRMLTVLIYGQHCLHEASISTHACRQEKLASHQRGFPPP